MIKQQWICQEDSFNFYVTDLPFVPRLNEFVDVAGFMPTNTEELKEKKLYYDETVFWVETLHWCKNDKGEIFVMLFLLDDSKTPLRIRK